MGVLRKNFVEINDAVRWGSRLCKTLTFLLEIFQQIISQWSMFICCPDHSGRRQGQSIIIADRNTCCIYIFLFCFFSAPLFVHSTMPASCNSLSTPLNPILILLLLQSLRPACPREVSHKASDCWGDFCMKIFYSWAVWSQNYDFCQKNLLEYRLNEPLLKCIFLTT